MADCKIVNEQKWNEIKSGCMSQVAIYALTEVMPLWIARICCAIAKKNAILCSLTKGAKSEHKNVM